MSAGDERESRGRPEEPPTKSLVGAPRFAGFAGEAVSAPAPGDVLVGKYRIIELVGSGGMGNVYGAVDSVLGRRVAVKTLRAVSTIDETVRRSLVSEGRSMAGLSHPNVCGILELVLDHPTPFLVMEWVDGIDLRRVWPDQSREERVRTYLKVVDAVAAVHDAGLIHRDLKPANILVDRRGEPVLVDFGLALRSSGRPSSLIGGTPGYAAPEQFSPNERVGAGADVYALGVILYELLTGRLPFEGGSVEEILRRIRTSDPPLPEQSDPTIPETLQRICLQAIERDPTRRYPSAREIAADLRRYIRGEPVSARPSVLAARFAEQVEAQVQAIERWHRSGLVTDEECRSLRTALSEIARPGSPWVLDTRRLTHRDALTHYGGWLCLLGLIVGMLAVETRLSASTRLCTAWLVTGIWLVVSLSNRRVPRRAQWIVPLIVGCLLTSASVWLTIRELGWFAGADGLGMGDAELLGESSGVLNRQVLASLTVLLVMAALIAVLTRAAAFSFVVAASMLATWSWLWLSLGGLDPMHDDTPAARIGRWTLALSVPMLAAGVMMSRRETRRREVLGPLRAAGGSAWPWLMFGATGTALAVDLIAWYSPAWFGWPLLASPESEPSRRAIGLVVSGLVLVGMAVLLGRHWTMARDRLARACDGSFPVISPSPCAHSARTTRGDSGCCG